MPMNKVSTFVYFFNTYQPESKNNFGESLNVKSKGMERLDVGPSDRTIENIMNFARSYEVYKTQETGYVEMNLN